MEPAPQLAGWPRPLLPSSVAQRRQVLRASE